MKTTSCLLGLMSTILLLETQQVHPLLLLLVLQIGQLQIAMQLEFVLRTIVVRRF
jgi:hypothetical protein